MSTANFRTMKDFPLMVKVYEADDYKFYKQFFYIGDSKDEADIKAAYEDWIENGGEAEMFYDDIFEGYDGFKDSMEKFNETLQFFELSFESGYYDGIQIVVNEKENDCSPEELENDEEADYYYGCTKEEAINDKNAEIEAINDWMRKVAKGEYGWTELNCVGVFSNGEAVYNVVA